MRENIKKELTVNIDGEQKFFNIEIVKIDKDNNEVEIKFLNFSKNPGIKTFDKCEVKIYQGGEIYVFDSRFSKVRDFGFYIDEPDNIRKLQRRKNRRYLYVTNVEIKKYKNNTFGKCFNLSKGGLGFYSKDLFSKGEILFIVLRCPFQRKTYNLEIEIMDSFIEEDGYIRYGTKFADWVKNEFDYLLRFLDIREQKKEKMKLIEKQLKEQENEEVEIPKKGFLRKLSFIKS